MWTAAGVRPPGTRAAALGLGLALAAACGNGDDGVDPRPDAISASCMEATMHSDLTWLQENVFTPGCAGFNSCHRGAALEAGGLSLEEGDLLPQTVNVDSDLFPQFKRIAPGDPDNSYMVIIMGGAAGPLAPDVGTMPYNNPRLCNEKVDAVKRWIAAGATDGTAADAGVD